MSKDTQDRLIELAKVLVGLGIAVLAYYLGAADLATFIAGGILGNAMPSRVSKPAFLLPLALTLGVSGCTPTQLAAAGGTAATVARVTCGAATKLAEACRAAGLAPHEPCPLFTVEAERVAAGETAGGEAE